MAFQTVFQYISCYSLSASSSALFALQLQFQYISCYSLSIQRILVRLLLIAFQYISCYSLSVPSPVLSLIDTCFNTSHVTLYRWIPNPVCMIFVVSIHLMLLFIPLAVQCNIAVVRFQYISCYSLSVNPLASLILDIVSIHLMLLFILPHHWLQNYADSGFNTSHVTLYRRC